MFIRLGYRVGHHLILHSGHERSFAVDGVNWCQADPLCRRTALGERDADSVLPVQRSPAAPDLQVKLPHSAKPRGGRHSQLGHGESKVEQRGEGCRTTPLNLQVLVLLSPAIGCTGGFRSSRGRRRTEMTSPI